ncbi:unnamed protein product, partial [Didymodactylos carnosus]
MKSSNSDAMTAIYCHETNESDQLTIRCKSNEKIRMLDAFYARAQNRTRPYCQQGFDINDCKVHTSFSSACSGRENCTIYLQRTWLSECSSNNGNENELWSDYTMAFYECIS